MRSASAALIVADAHGERGVAVPAVDDGAAVDRDDVALVEDAGAGDAVDDLVVDAGADHRREAVVAEEVRRGAAPVEHVAGGGVEVAVVVAPGRTASRQTACISATTRPARRITAISSRLRRATIATVRSGRVRWPG